MQNRRWKKKYSSALGILILTGGLLGYSIMQQNQRLPGTSVSEEVSLSIDCTANVLNYQYSAADRDKEIMTLKECDFSFLEDMKIPGMPETKEEDLAHNYIYSMSQCPQGICFTGEYILITSYSEEEDCLGALMVFDGTTGKYLVTLGMDPESHLGGLTFDGKNIWVCNSSKNTLERLSYDFVQLMATENEGDVIDASQVVDSYAIGNTPSYVTYDRGRLWVGTFRVYCNGVAVAYHYDYNEDALVKLSKFATPPRVQGLAFGEDGAVYCSCCYGRKLSSYIKKYDSVSSMAVLTKNPSVMVEMPPCSEEIAYKDGTLYVIFESAGDKYYSGSDGKGKSIAPINKILMIETKSMNLPGRTESDNMGTGKWNKK